jgi:hypothetical protein
MAGFLLHQGATVTCAHGGQAEPTATAGRVLVGGEPVVVQSDIYVISGCPFVPPAGNGPCVTAEWISGATRVFAQGIPVVLSDSQAVCVPTGAPLVIIESQQRVSAT